MSIRNVHIRSPFDVAETADRVFRALSIKSWHERDSDNFTDGRYYVGEGGETQVEVSSDEKAGFDEYLYRVTLELPSSSTFDVDEVLDLMALELVRAGFDVAREVGFHDGVIERERFALDRSSNLIKCRDTVQVPED